MLCDCIKQLICKKIVLERCVELVAEGEVITSVVSIGKRSEYILVIAEPEATDCFSINFQVIIGDYTDILEIHACSNPSPSFPNIVST